MTTTSRFSTRRMALAGLIAAVYAAATLFLPIPQYGGVQFRVAEAMTLLPFLFPEAIPGLAVGCFLANLLGSPFVLDWIFGTLATLLAALWSRRMPNVYLAALPPVVCNAVIVGAEIAWFTVQEGGAFWPAYGLNALTVGLGELAACYLLGVPLARMLGKNPRLAETRYPE
ncbi:QueT transporter family protein [Oscillospiraceae bacterium 38-13]